MRPVRALEMAFAALRYGRVTRTPFGTLEAAGPLAAAAASGAKWSVAAAVARTVVALEIPLWTFRLHLAGILAAGPKRLAAASGAKWSVAAAVARTVVALEIPL